jgi:hypothetical protein
VVMEAGKCMCHTGYRYAFCVCTVLVGVLCLPWFCVPRVVFCLLPLLTEAGSFGDSGNDILIAAHLYINIYC